MPGDRDDVPPDPLDDAQHAEREGRPGFVPEFVRKAAVAGLGAIFMTEEGIRSLAGQLKLPKEMLGHIVSQAEKTKDEIGRVLTEEIRRFLQSEKLREEFLKLISGMTLEVKAQIRLVPSDEKPLEKEEGGPASKTPEAAAVQPKVVISELNARRGGKRTPKKE
ncbi:hypothetical protein [Stigmatella aurantiaca]|uniref:Conserved uncharacterized protein n=1 Tax=Stigmatella aurantiaca (strain DW4/3-1) TaxID=378806 RepID=Q08P35_STIAD|nr:hypothetical protein [Stigmatella aurantiaca]ADO72132.1 conserved uncharacterized protein [Stigmatella aurantiaca DW4/3-1]EAU62252.1 conserved hypothetical protein [Stigmatella aurantiaca DW4/3-1]